MKYISTRGGGTPQSFEQVLLTGLAPDGGLYVPEELPSFSPEQIASWRDLSYVDLALAVISPFIGDALQPDELKRIITESYADFGHPEVAPLTALREHEYLLELYHGPTLAFKDFALQVLGRLLDHVLTKNDQRVVILGATSGDTGSAALEGCRHSDRVDIFILHPHQRVSEVQRRQMTTVPGDNVFNLAVEGNFDDCQRIVKAAFSDQSFLPDDRQLVAVNSINWARILMQIVYYFAAALRLGAPDRQVSFSVPTGNFGDIYAGYLAKQMGLPVDQLVVATNQNDILHRFISNNDYSNTDYSYTDYSYADYSYTDYSYVRVCLELPLAAGARWPPVRVVRVRQRQELLLHCGAVELRLQSCGCGAVAVELWLWSCGCGAVAVKLWL